jgi:hypothetical protein
LIVRLFIPLPAVITTNRLNPGDFVVDYVGQLTKIEPNQQQMFNGTTVQYRAATGKTMSVFITMF